MRKQNLVLHTIIEYYIYCTVLHILYFFAFCFFWVLGLKKEKLNCWNTAPTYISLGDSHLIMRNRFKKCLHIHQDMEIRSVSHALGSMGTVSQSGGGYLRMIYISSFTSRNQKKSIPYLVSLHLSHSVNEIKNLPKLNYIIVGQK